MASTFPKLPGYVPTQDCTKTQHHRVSHKMQESKLNPYNKAIPLYPVPDPPSKPFAPEKTEASLSTS